MTEGNKMRERPVNELMVEMGIPMILSMALQAVYNIVDSAFVGNMKAGNGLKCFNACISCADVDIALAVGTGVGTNALLARCLGQKNQKKAARVAGNALFLGLMIYL